MDLKQLNPSSTKELVQASKKLLKVLNVKKITVAAGYLKST